MKRNISGTVFFIILTAVILGCADSMPFAADAAIDSPAAQAQPDPGGATPANLQEERAPEPALTPAARETYAYLLFIQALLDEDEAALLDVTPELAAANAPISVWLDGGVWLISRKSPNSVIFLERALKSHPDDLSLNLLYAESLGDHGMAAEGVNAIRAFLEKNPGNMDARMELALLLVKDKKFDEAQKILAQITQKQRTPLVDYYQARALMGMDKPLQAIPYLRKAIKGMPDFVDAIMDLAVIYEEEGNWREARTAYEKLQKLNISPDEVALKLVELSLKLKQPEKAAQYVRHGPPFLRFKLKAASMLLEARNYLQAESILKQIADKENTPYEVYLMLADLVYDQRRNLNMAFSWLDKIPENSPGASKACALRVQLLLEAGKTGQALETANKGIDAFPDSIELWDMKIRILAREKKYDEALATAREAAEKWPSSDSISFLLGSLLDEMGKKKEAFAIMEDLIKKQPNNYQALNYVGFTLAEENRDIERALELLKKADELSPNQAYIVDSLAWALFRAGKGEDALRQIRRAINLSETHDAAIWEHYGDIARNQGHKDEARKAYRRAIELKPANAGDIRKRLSTL